MAKFADLHCHPDGKNFYKYSVSDGTVFNGPKAHLWTLPPNKFRPYISGNRGTRYSQADVGRCIRGNTKLVFASIYPFEQGFIMKIKNDKVKKPPAFLVNIATAYTYLRIRYVRNDPKYNYWLELEREFEFMLRKSGQWESAQIRYKKSGEAHEGPRAQEVSGKYWIIAHNPADWERDSQTYGPRKLARIEELTDISKRDNEVAMVLTIEGMHSISMENLHTPVPEAVLMERIDTLKRWPIFFITFSHHFNNNLCAHAKSFFKVPIGNPDQTLNMNRINDGSEFGPETGFNALGRKALEKLLSIVVTRNADDKVTAVADDPNGGRRILIDVKHMAATGRRELYEVLDAYNQGKPLPDRIPIVASHVAYSGLGTLDELIARMDRNDKKGMENDTDHDPAYGKFNPWNINMSNEDVQKICQSGGLIGLSLDQRILGVMHKFGLLQMVGIEHRQAKKADPLELVMNNILGMANAMRGPENLHQFREDAHTFWHCLALGSDYDGGIDPVNRYQTLMQYPALRDDLKQAFTRQTDKWTLTDYGITPDNVDRVLDLICFENARRFAVERF